MLKKIILIEGENDCQCDSLNEVIENLIDEQYYELPIIERKEKLRMRAIANCLGNEYEVLENLTSKSNIDKKIIIENEITYILSLLLTNKITLLERIDSDIFTKGLDKSKFEKNYILVNKFAKELLLEYMNKGETSNDKRN